MRHSSISVFFTGFLSFLFASSLFGQDALVDDFSDTNDLNKFGQQWDYYDDNIGTKPDDRPQAAPTSVPSVINVPYTLRERHASGNPNDHWIIKDYTFSFDGADNKFVTMPFTYGVRWHASWCSPSDSCAWPYIGVFCGLAPEGAYIDLSGATGARFKIKSRANPLKVSFRVETYDIIRDSSFAFYGDTLTTSKSWQTKDILFSNLKQPSWVSSPMIRPFDITKVVRISWEVHRQDNQSIALDTLDLDDIYINNYSHTNVPPLLLDDFEDGNAGNKIGTYWYFWSDSNSTINNAGPEQQFIGGYGPGNGSTYAGVMDFTMRPGATSHEAMMGFRFDNGASPVDLSGATAVQFDIKANRPMVIKFRTEQSTILDYDYYNEKINVDTSWTTVMVNLFAGAYGLSQEPWGDTTVPFAIDKLTNLVWEYRPNDNTGADSSGVVSIDNIKIIGTPAGLHAPFAPFLIYPGWESRNNPVSPIMTWRSSAGATSYCLQVSTSNAFNSYVVNQSNITDTTYQVSGLAYGTTYYWRVNATGEGFTSRWSSVTSFTTIAQSAIIAKKGWNMISFNIHPEDSSVQAIFDSLRGFVLAKNNAGLVYWPAYRINDIGSIRTGEGYKIYTDSLDTIRTRGLPIDVATTPISLSAGWNMAAYLPKSNMPIGTALSGAASQITIVKNNAGQVYWPDYNINTIGDMHVGDGYKIHMKNAAILTYPSIGIPKVLAEGKIFQSPAPQHYLFKRNTGSNATILTKQVTFDGALAADNSEIGGFDEQGNLVGSGVVMKGKAAFSVWGDDFHTKEKDGCVNGEKISFKLWNGTREYPIEYQATTTVNYQEDGIYAATFSASERMFISKFALRTSYPNPFKNRTIIMFDVPSIDNKEAQDVEINIYGLNGCLIHQLAKGKYKTGHYSATWNADDDAPSGSNVYIIRMRAAHFDNKLRLFRVK
jgi:hypothetical protein